MDLENVLEDTEVVAEVVEQIVYIQNDILMYVIILMLGVIILCLFTNKSRK